MAYIAIWLIQNHAEGTCYWGFDAHSVTIQYTENIAIIVRNIFRFNQFPDYRAASLGQPPYNAPLLPVREVVEHNTDGHIIECFRI